MERIIEEKTEAGIDTLKDYARSAADQAKAQLEPIGSWLKETIAERPLTLLAGTLGLGYLVGRLVRRRP